MPIRSAVKALEAKNWVDRRLSSLASTNPYLRIVYEEFAKDNRSGLESCLSFLGCDIRKLPPVARFIEKQSKQPASAYIRNHDELSKVLETRGLRMSTLIT